MGEYCRSDIGEAHPCTLWRSDTLAPCTVDLKLLKCVFLSIMQPQSIKIFYHGLLSQTIEKDIKMPFQPYRST